MVQARAAHQEQSQQLSVDDLVFLDESGVTTSMTRRYGRAPKGERVVDFVPQGHWKVMTILGALTRQGMQAAMTVDGATDKEVFWLFLEQVLGPTLRPGQVVVMDNLPAHKNARVRELIEARGCRLLYLPPYSPDFNPIEKAWSKLKTYLRAVKARAWDKLDEEVAAALKTITAADAAGWFRHCGYTLHST